MGPDPENWVAVFLHCLKQELGHEVMEKALAGVRGIYSKNGGESELFNI